MECDEIKADFLKGNFSAELGYNIDFCYSLVSDCL